MYAKEETRPSAARIEKVQQAKRQIDEHIKALAAEMRQGKSEQLERLLQYFSKFHHYSLGNLCLAIMQRPNITRLAGLRQWNKLGRTVKRGERGIMILAPISIKTSDMEEEDAQEGANGGRSVALAKKSEQKTFFKPVFVFDIAQTEGEEPPQVIHAQGDVTRLWPALQLVVKRAAIQLDFVEVIGNRPTAEGASLGGRILLKKGLSEADAFRTLAHEYAHELLHHRSGVSEQCVRETEADATAYVVCRHYGLQCDTSDYLLLYDSKPELLYARLEMIRQTANWIIDGIEAVREQIKMPRGEH